MMIEWNQFAPKMKENELSWWQKIHLYDFAVFSSIWFLNSCSEGNLGQFFYEVVPGQMLWGLIDDESVVV